MLLVNVINLSVLVWMLLNSGDRERRIIRGQLQDEQPPVIEAVERKSLDDQRRYHRRKLGSDDRRNRRIVHAQNELAFRRCQPWRAKRRLVDPSSREAALFSRRALRQRENKVGLRTRRPVIGSQVRSSNELAKLLRSAW